MLLMLSAFDIVALSLLGLVIVATIVVGILNLVKRRKVSNNNPKKGGK